MAGTLKKLTEEEKYARIREQKKMIMRKLREQIKQNPVALAEQRRKDRERKRKAKGLVKTIAKLTHSDQPATRKNCPQKAKND